MIARGSSSLYSFHADDDRRHHERLEIYNLWRGEKILYNIEQCLGSYLFYISFIVISNEKYIFFYLLL